ncbi:MAG: tetratricopeptide repeat protein [Anaerolineae bacterium]
MSLIIVSPASFVSFFTFSACSGVIPGPALDHYNRGVRAYDAGHYDEAIAEYREAIRLDSTLGVAHLNLGLCYLERSNWLNGAEQEFNEALKYLDEPHTISLAENNLGVVYERRGEFQQACEQYRVAISLDETNHLAQGNLERLRQAGLCD